MTVTIHRYCHSSKSPEDGGGCGVEGGPCRCPRGRGGEVPEEGDDAAVVERAGRRPGTRLTPGSAPAGDGPAAGPRREPASGGGSGGHPSGARAEPARRGEKGGPSS